MERRKFIKNTMSFALLVAFHKAAQSCTSPGVDRLREKVEKSADVVNARFPEILLYTSKLEEQFEFYSTVLEFPVISKDETQFSLRIGESILRFKEVEDGTEPFYHYAINIPSNKHEKAKEWLSAKTELLKDSYSGDELFYFDFWDAHAMYFKDPSGNIGELIARHTLDNDKEGEFDVSDLLCISEIGTPVEDPEDFSSELKANYGLEPHGESMFVGDENGLFVLVPVDRLWYPEYTQEAKVYPVEILMSGEGSDELKYKDYPYSIQRKK